MKSKIIIILSYLLGSFFIFSFVTKIIILNDWFNFNYLLLENEFGYLNGVIILIVELMFGIQFLRLKITTYLLSSSILFVLILTIFVLINSDLFESCMCFGSIIDVEPDWDFAIKNIFLMCTISIVFFLKEKCEVFNIS